MQLIRWNEFVGAYLGFIGTAVPEENLACGKNHRSHRKEVCGPTSMKE